MFATKMFEMIESVQRAQEPHMKSFGSGHAAISVEGE